MDEGSKVIIICAVVFVMFFGLMFITATYSLTKFNSICDSLKPTWTVKSTFSFSDETCFYESQLNSKEVEYFSEEYYLIDNNHLGRRVDLNE
jgi:hypothetical protein